jgi:hypothetical protein
LSVGRGAVCGSAQHATSSSEAASANLGTIDVEVTLTGS